LNYIHMVLLPVLASMFEHLGANKYGSEVLVGEIQTASYKILNGLWILGTCGTKLIDRPWVIEELNRHRPLLGECLGSFAGCFPIAFLEPQYNANNKCSIIFGLNDSNLSDHSLEAQDIMSKLSKNLPPLDALINQLKELSESGHRHTDEPHITEVILPTLCSYLNYWWFYGPSAIKKEQQANKFDKAKSIDVEKTPPPNQARGVSSTKTATPHMPTPAPVIDKREE
jgi:ryanodine receptor 2